MWVDSLSKFFVNDDGLLDLFDADLRVDIFLIADSVGIRLGNVRVHVGRWLLVELFGFLVLLDEILNLVATFLDLLSEFLLDARDS